MTIEEMRKLSHNEKKAIYAYLLEPIYAGEGHLVLSHVQHVNAMFLERSIETLIGSIRLLDVHVSYADIILPRMNAFDTLSPEEFLTFISL